MKNWLYQNTPDDRSRYVLGEKGARILGCLGINPSTARPGALDNTLRSVKRIAHYNGYDGWVMFNIYPLRATDPNMLPKNPDIPLHQKNLKVVRKRIKELEIKECWLAYGNLIDTRNYLSEFLPPFLDMFRELHISCKIFKSLTVKGHPRHPLYLPSKSNLVDFDPGIFKSRTP